MSAFPTDLEVADYGR